MKTYEEQIQDLRDKAEFLRKTNYDSNTHNSFAETMSQAADAIEELTRAHEQWIEQERNAMLKSIPKWIPVTERLPREKETVLTWGKKETILFDWRYDNKWCCFGGVTHWMPLPEPPKEETE